MFEPNDLISGMADKYLREQYAMNEHQIKNWLKSTGWVPPEGSNTAIQYKFNEPEILAQIRAYIDSTYEKHYARNDRQTFESIVDSGHGEGFAMGNVKKYGDRYGTKNGYNRDDLMKLIHYAILALYVHDLTHGGVSDNGNV